MESGLYATHLLLCAVWFGSMTYSLAVVQPAARDVFADDGEREAFLVRLAAGNRWRVVALVGAIAVTGLGWWWAGGRDETIVQAVRAVALTIAACLFWYVSWRHWPRRVLALPAELPALRARLTAIAVTMTALIGVVLLLGLLIGP